MNLRKILLLAVAGLLTVLTVWSVRSYLDGQRAELAARARLLQQKPAATGTMVLVAKVDLPTGSFIKPDHLRWQPWPDDNVAPTYVRQDRRRAEEFTGSVVRARIAAGEPITDGRVVKPDDRGFMAAVLTPGMRAVSVSINPTSGISGFVLPGDRVDLVLTHAIKSEREGGGGERHASETILGDLRVLAVDQKVQEKNGEPIVARTATLEVTAKQVELIAVATELGKLSLSLRSLGRQEGEESEYLSGADIGAGKPLAAATTAAGKTFTWDQEASQLLASRRVTVMRGGATSEVSVDRGGQ